MYILRRLCGRDKAKPLAENSCSGIVLKEMHLLRPKLVGDLLNTPKNQDSDDFNTTSCEIFINKCDPLKVNSIMLRNIDDSAARQSRGLAKLVPKRCLAVFDFDYTVVADNTDTVVRDLLDPQLIPHSLKDVLKRAGWTMYMSEIFRLLHKSGVTRDQICTAIRNIPEVPGMVRLLKSLVEWHNMEVIIISDSNSLFIGEWLRAHGLEGMMAEIITNPACFDDNGMLCIRPYEFQDICKISPANLCKGRTLECYIMQQELRDTTYERVIYVGDGSNDICPVLTLEQNGIACPRNGFPMHKQIVEAKGSLKINAMLLVWDNGFDLLKKLMKVVNGEPDDDNKDDNDDNNDADDDANENASAKAAK